MELRDFLKLISRGKRWVLGPAVVVTVAVFLVSSYWPVSYRASATVYVQKTPEEPQAGDYTYDGYYAQQSAEAYTDTVQGFLQSLDILKRAAEIAALPSDTPRLSFYKKRIKSEKVAPQLIAVSISLRDAQQAQDLVVALAQATQERARVLNQAGERGMMVDLVTARPLLQEQRPLAWLNATVAFGATLVIAAAALTVGYYLKNEA